ncbi:MAG: FliG C-terminal domain-containing protein [Pseudomonadota bacterium]
MTELQQDASTGLAPAPTDQAPAPAASLADESPTLETLTRQQKAAIVIGVIGPDAAGPLLERLDESSLRGFAEGMSRLKRIEPEVVNAVIREFLHELDRADSTIRGGLKLARGMLERHLDDQTLTRILDGVDAPSVHNVWRKLAKVSEEAIADFLKREHPQTAAVVLSKLSSEQAAGVLSRFPPDRARDVVMGITKTQNLDPKVIETIGASVSRDFLAGQNADGVRRDPAERVGSIMNFTAAEVRTHVLDSIGESQPDFAEEIKRKMFTFEDIPARIETRDVSAIIRGAEPDVLLRALAGARETMPESAEFILSNISSRMAEQLRENLNEIGKVRRKESEAAQNEIIMLIRGMVDRAEIKLVVSDEDG